MPYKRASSRGSAKLAQWAGLALAAAMPLLMPAPPARAQNIGLPAADARSGATAQVNDRTLAAALLELGDLYRKGAISPEDGKYAEGFYGRFGGSEAAGDVIAVVPPSELLEQASSGLPDGPAALRLYREAAERGAPLALLRIGAIYESGKLVPRDAAGAASAYRQASAAGLQWGDVRYGVMLARGDGMARDVPGGLAMIRRIAEIADPAAFVVLGDLLLDGTIGPPDAPGAIAAYRNAAAAGEATGAVRLGKLYAEGTFVAADPAVALEHYREAAAIAAGRYAPVPDTGPPPLHLDPGQVASLVRAGARGDAGALYKLGTYYYSGEASVVDYAKAYYYFDQAASRVPAAQLMLGLMHAFGQGVAQDYQTGRDLVAPLAAAGNVEALLMQARLYSDEDAGPVDLTKALAALDEAAHLGSLAALLQLGNGYVEGTLGEPDSRKAVAYFRAAADLGSREARLAAARLLVSGPATGQDLPAAIGLLAPEAAAGNLAAKLLLAGIYATPGAGVADSAKAIALYAEAAAAGSLDALVRLGDLYRDGQLVAADPARAAAYYLQAAAAAGSPDAAATP